MGNCTGKAQNQTREQWQNSFEEVRGEIALGKTPEIVFDKMKKSRASPTVNFSSEMMLALLCFSPNQSILAPYDIIILFRG